MVVGDQQLAHTPSRPSGYWGPCAPFVLKQGFPFPLCGPLSTNQVEALDIYFHRLLFLQAEQNKTTIEGLLRERDFYFNKLRSIEIICQENRKVDLTKSIFEILYATEVSRLSSHLILNKYFHLINYNVGDHFFPVLLP
ncbi:unnamed protein product [Schistosoma margrebowiei]|uniref:Uncharacterized protein n=1 Tax=Schistosoma margrebowiei TaxID=48269 RepID=A0A183M5U1_9TREM|nr:unnamed protein product [Schistosoma margrebowiei]